MNLTLLSTLCVLGLNDLLYIDIDKDIDILMNEEGSQHKFEVEKIPEEQEYAPRLEPAALIRLADRNNAHYPSRRRTILKKKDGSMTDFKRTHSDPHGSHRKMLHVLLTHLPPRCALTFFPRSRRASSQTLENTSLQGAQRSKIYYSERRESQ